MLVPKPDGSIRFCTDYRKVNAITKGDTYPLPLILDCIDRVRNAEYVTKIDLLRGYWCMPLTKRVREISAFVTPFGLYEYNVMAFGLKNAPARLQRLINQNINGLDRVEAYLDDSNSWEEHLRILQELFARLAKAQMTVNLAKSDFGKATVAYLGHNIGQGKVKPLYFKVQAILDFPNPINMKELGRYLGLIGFYRIYCKNLASVVSPMTELLKKGNKFNFPCECIDAFAKSKAL